MPSKIGSYPQLKTHHNSVVDVKQTAQNTMVVKSVATGPHNPERKCESILGSRYHFQSGNITRRRIGDVDIGMGCDMQRKT